MVASPSRCIPCPICAVGYYSFQVRFWGLNKVLNISVLCMPRQKVLVQLNHYYDGLSTVCSCRVFLSRLEHVHSFGSSLSTHVFSTPLPPPAPPVLVIEPRLTCNLGKQSVIELYSCDNSSQLSTWWDPESPRRPDWACLRFTHGGWHHSLVGILEKTERVSWTQALLLLPDCRCHVISCIKLLRPWLPCYDGLWS